MLKNIVEGFEEMMKLSYDRNLTSRPTTSMRVGMRAKNSSC